MTTTGLIALLHRIRDGVATSDELARARELARDDDRLPLELRQADLLADDPVDDAVALLALLDAEPLFGAMLGEALRAEAGELEQVDLDDPAWEPLAAALREGIATEVRAFEAAHGATFGVAVLVAAHRVTGFAPDRRAASPPVADAVRAEAGSADVAAGVHQALGVAALPDVAAAVRAEAGRIDVVEAVLAAIGAPAALPVGEAVRAEAGAVDVADVVGAVTHPAWLSALVDHELSPAAHRLAARQLLRDPSLGAVSTAMVEVGAAVRRAVADEAGDVDSVWPEVASAIGLSDPEAVPGWDGALVREAVLAEAGTVDVRAAVMSRVLASSVRRSDLGRELELPQPANAGSWRVGFMALAAALMVAVIGGRYWAEQATTAQPEVHLQFASASEIQIDDLVPGADSTVMVIHEDDDNAPLIIWVDEEAML